MLTKCSRQLKQHEKKRFFDTYVNVFNIFLLLVRMNELCFFKANKIDVMLCNFVFSFIFIGLSLKNCNRKIYFLKIKRNKLNLRRSEGIFIYCSRKAFDY